MHLVDDYVAHGNALGVQRSEQAFGLCDRQLRRDGHDAELRRILILEQVPQFHLT